MEVGAHEIQLLPLVKQAVVGFEADACAVFTQDTPAQAVDSGDAHGGEVPGAAGGLGGGGEALAQLVGGTPGEGAHQQLGGNHRAQQQQVAGAPDDGARLAGAGAGDHQQWPLGVGDYGALPAIQLGLQMADYG